MTRNLVLPFDVPDAASHATIVALLRRREVGVALTISLSTEVSPGDFVVGHLTRDAEHPVELGVVMAGGVAPSPLATEYLERARVAAGGPLIALLSSRLFSSVSVIPLPLAERLTRSGGTSLPVPAPEPSVAAAEGEVKRYDVELGVRRDGSLVGFDLSAAAARNTVGSLYVRSGSPEGADEVLSGLLASERLTAALTTVDGVLPTVVVSPRPVTAPGLRSTGLITDDLLLRSPGYLDPALTVGTNPHDAAWALVDALTLVEGVDVGHEAALVSAVQTELTDPRNATSADALLGNGLSGAAGTRGISYSAITETIRRLRGSDPLVTALLAYDPGAMTLSREVADGAVRTLVEVDTDSLTSDTATAVLELATAAVAGPFAGRGGALVLVDALDTPRAGRRTTWSELLLSITGRELRTTSVLFVATGARPEAEIRESTSTRGFGYVLDLDYDGVGATLLDRVSSDGPIERLRVETPGEPDRGRTSDARY